MVTPSPDDFRRALESHPRLEMSLPGRSNHLLTGVLVPLVWDPRPVCILTLRAAHLSKHAGEVCFPGGRPDPEDADLLHTALREAHEELGIEDARVLGELSSMPLYTSDYRLRPFVAEVPKRPLVVNRSEVAEVLTVALDEMLALSSIDAIPWTIEGYSSMSPVFQLGEHKLFGATAHSFYELLVLSAPLFDSEVPPLVAGRYDWSDLNPQRSKSSG